MRSLILAVLAGPICATMALGEPVKTSKERLSDKASDEQRVDDCRVPPERRGAATRPDCSDQTTPGAAKAAPAPRPAR